MRDTNKALCTLCMSDSSKGGISKVKNKIASQTIEL